MNRELLKKELTRDEDLRLTAYQDSVGLWTIGVGHLLGTDPRMTKITNDECTALLNHDLEIAETRVTALVKTWCELDDVRQRALVNMSFNLGNRLAGFNNFLAAIEAKEWLEAGESLVDSKWYFQVKGRAVRIRRMIEEGVAV